MSSRGPATLAEINKAAGYDAGLRIARFCLVSRPEELGKNASPSYWDRVIPCEALDVVVSSKRILNELDYHGWGKPVHCRVQDLRRRKFY